MDNMGVFERHTPSPGGIFRLDGRDKMRQQNSEKGWTVEGDYKISSDLQ